MQGNITLLRMGVTAGLLSGFAVFFTADTSAAAGADIGIGVSSVYSGRHVPVLNTVFRASDMALSLNASGVKTSLYSHGVLQAAVFYYREAPAAFGKLATGLGLGAARSVRTYQADRNAEKEQANEEVSGLAGKVTMHFPGGMHLSMEGLYGKGSRSVFLIFKPYAQFTAGVSF